MISPDAILTIGNAVQLTVICRLCRTPHEITTARENYIAWLNGKLIQNAMPDLSSAERELLISGKCGDCFDKM